jgi:hypothetical protein
LHWAAGAGHAAVVGALLEAGARPNLNDTCCNTPLHFAVWGGHLEVMQSLLQADGGLAGQANSGGFTPLHWAARQGHLEAVKLLLQHGANPRSHTDDEDFTPLNLAEENVLASLHPCCSGPHLPLAASSYLLLRLFCVQADALVSKSSVLARPNQCQKRPAIGAKETHY